MDSISAVCCDMSSYYCADPFPETMAYRNSLLARSRCMSACIESLFKCYHQLKLQFDEQQEVLLEQGMLLEAMEAKLATKAKKEMKGMKAMKATKAMKGMKARRSAIRQPLEPSEKVVAAVAEKKRAGRQAMKVMKKATKAMKKS